MTAYALYNKSKFLAAFIYPFFVKVFIFFCMETKRNVLKINYFLLRKKHRNTVNLFFLNKVSITFTFTFTFYSFIYILKY